MAGLPENVYGGTLLAFGPQGTFQLSQLAGGLINETVRAFCRHGSFIMKYAPPYIAAIGPSAPFGQERQVRFSSLAAALNSIADVVNFPDR